MEVEGGTMAILYKSNAVARIEAPKRGRNKFSCEVKP